MRALVRYARQLADAGETTLVAAAVEQILSCWDRRQWGTELVHVICAAGRTAEAMALWRHRDMVGSYYQVDFALAYARASQFDDMDTHVAQLLTSVPLATTSQQSTLVTRELVA